MITAKQFLEWYTDNHKNASNAKVAEMLASLPSQERDTIKRLTKKTYRQRVENAAAADRARKLERGEAWILTDTIEMLDAMYGQGAGAIGKAYLIRVLKMEGYVQERERVTGHIRELATLSHELDRSYSLPQEMADQFPGYNDRSNR